MKKSIRSLICGLGTALLLWTCLPADALAASGQPSFSSMFPDCAEGAKDPAAAEEVLAGMGTVIGQSRTVNGVTLTLNGAVWNDGALRLSFAIQGANIPKDIPSGTGLNRFSSRITLAESQRATYIRKSMEENEKILSEQNAISKPFTQAEREADIQSSLNRGEPQFVHRFQLVRGGGKDFLMMALPIAPYVEKPELTVHLEDLIIYQKGDLYSPNLFEGFEPAFCLSGPYEFTFTVEKHMEPLVYTGAVDVTVGDVPVQVTRVRVTAFGAKAEYVTAGQVNVEKDWKKLEPVALRGVWTKDGQRLEGTGLGLSGFTPMEGGKVQGHLNNTYPYVLDPARVTAVDVGGVRVDLSRLTLREEAPLKSITVIGGPSDA